MGRSQEAVQGFLEALDEPALLVAAGSGTVRHANAAALRLLGGSPAEPLAGRTLGELTADPPETVATLLRRCAGSGQTVLATLQLRTGGAGEARRCQCRGNRLPRTVEAGAEPLLLLLRLQDVAHDRFRVLTRKIVALNEEIRHSRRIQRQLEVTLEQRLTLLRELHHRVKNNLQVLLGILSLAERKARAPEAREMLAEARLRVEAMGVLQRLLYDQPNLARVDAQIFLGELCTNLERAFRRPGITVQVEPTTAQLGLDLASSLGLILNELLTNAFKHAFSDRETGGILVELHQEEAGKVVLVVEDDGRGLGDGAPPRSGTGLTLVRGLAQQQGGECQVEPAPGRASGGVRCTVVLRDRQGSGR